MDKTFQKNCTFLQNVDSQLAYKIMATDPSNLQFSTTKQGELNLSRTYGGKSYHYHAVESAAEEAIEWFKNLDLNEASVLFVYGVGLGYYYEAAKEWLKKKKERALVFLEEDLGVLYRLLETERGGKLIKDPQVQIVYFHDLVEDKAVFNNLSWIYVKNPFAISCIKLYEEVNQEGFNKLHHTLSYNLIEKKVFAEEYLQYGIAFYRNFYPNLLELPHAYWGNGLFGQFKNTPAIICGAGPSLNKNLHLLKEYKDKALIFAGSSALNALIPKGIIPHFGAAVDPNKAQLPRVKVTEPYKIPFFYRNRLFNEALKAITGAKLYLTGTGGYDVADWFEEELGINGKSLDEGHNIVNFCIEIAYALGCNPIVLVGLDLAFTNEQHYAEGITESLQLTEADFKRSDDFEAQPIVRDDIHGQPVHTLWKWITESEWVAHFAENHPDVTLINATEGGIGFNKVPNELLKDVAEKYFKSNPDLGDQIGREIKQHTLSKIKPARLIDTMRRMQKSLDSCIDLLSMILNKTDELEKMISRGDSYPEKLETTQISLIEHDLEEEPAYQFILETFNQVYIRFHFREIQNLQSIKTKLSVRKRDLLKVNLQKERLTFLKDVARVNRELIERTLRDNTHKT